MCIVIDILTHFCFYNDIIDDLLVKLRSVYRGVYLVPGVPYIGYYTR